MLWVGEARRTFDEDQLGSVHTTLRDAGVVRSCIRHSGLLIFVGTVAVLIDLERLIFRVKRLRLRLDSPLYPKGKIWRAMPSC